MNAKSFLCAAVGIFLLAAYTVGASRVQGQVSGSRLVAVTDYQNGNSTQALVAVTENGDWYYQLGYTQQGGPWWPNTQWIRGGNIGVGPVGVNAATWSRTKGTYRK